MTRLCQVTSDPIGSVSGAGRCLLNGQNGAVVADDAEERPLDVPLDESTTSVPASTTASPQSHRRSDDEIRRTIRRQAFSIVLAVAPFAIVFGAAAARTGLTFWETVGFSALVFAGSVQFAAVQILGDGGSVASATIAGLLLGVRSLALGIILAPVLTGRWWKRMAMSQVVLDESIAVGAVQPTRRWQRYGFLVTGVGVYVLWNISTVIGFVMFAGAEGLITDLGLDTAGPAALLALLWPRLSSTPQRRTAIAAGLIALACTPFMPAGVPILLSMFGVAAALLPPSFRPARPA
jgi:predicted branched-subunit amino acid permease